MKTADVIIVGAGLGGLATAIRLAARGAQVTILEKNATVGGKVNLVRADGFSFDTGASLLTMRHVVDELFAVAGKLTANYLDIIALDTICRYQWSDGATLDTATDLTQTEDEIRRLADGAEVHGFRRFLADARRKYEVAERTFLAHSLNDLPQLLRPRYARDLAVISSWRTLDAHNRKYFRSPKLQQLFNRYATYNGSSPYQTPATFALIPYVEFGLGAWYVRGGMYELPSALAKLARELGVEIITNAEVAQIDITDGRARGVMLTNGEQIRARTAVVSNADALTTYQNLIDERARRSFTDAKIARIEPSCSGFVILLGVNRRYENLAHHNIFFSDDYAAEFRAIFKDLRPAAAPTVYVCAASRTDATQAPPGCENLFILINAPALSAQTDWKNTAQSYRDSIIEILERRGMENLAQHIVFEKILTPENFATDYGAYRGALYGLSSNKMLNAFWRPPNKARDIAGLYFTGGATHPGGGIPLVLLSGKMAADLIARYEADML